MLKESNNNQSNELFVEHEGIELQPENNWGEIAQTKSGEQIEHEEKGETPVAVTPAHDPEPEALEALHLKIDALEIQHAAHEVQIMALELLNQHIRRELLHGPAVSAPAETELNAAAAGNDNNELPEDAAATEGIDAEEEEVFVKSPILKLELPLKVALQENLEGESFNKPTFNKLKGILLCLYDQEKATLEELTEYVGGTVPALRRHVSTLERAGMIEQLDEKDGKRLKFGLSAKGQTFFRRLRQPALSFR